MARVLIRPSAKKLNGGVSIPGANQGYISHRNKQRQRIASSYTNRPAVVAKGDLFANTRQPVKRLTATNTAVKSPPQNQKVKYQNIYSMVTKQQPVSSTTVNSPDKMIDPKSIYNNAANSA